MFKSLIKFCSNIKIPWRVKNKFHDNFHCTSDQIYSRKISKLITEGADKNKIIENISGKKLSEIDSKELKELDGWIDSKIAQINQQDKAFDNVIPALFPQKYYRGVFKGDSELQNLKKGDIITDHGYSWLTPSKSYAKDFSHGDNGVLIETTVPAGTKISRDICVDSDGISGLNPFTSMNIVLQRNTRYEVLEKGIKNNQNYIKLKYLGI